MEETLRRALASALDRIGAPSDSFTVEHPTHDVHGDYATNVALVVARARGENPRELAEQLRDSLEGTLDFVDRIEVAGPGFLNFYLSRDFFSSSIAEAISSGDRWGFGSSESGQKVVFEYTSPNLFKPLHVGNLVGNIVGESLSRLFEMQGAFVHRVTYPSDIGLTVAKGVWGLVASGGDPSDIHALGEAYRLGNEAYEQGGTSKEAIEEVNGLLYAGSDSRLSDLRERGKQTSLAHIHTLCDFLGTSFDTVIFESDTGPIGRALVLEHLDDNIFERDDGALVFRGDRHGLHTRVFVTSKDLPTYEAKDLGNFSLKQDQYPDWTRSVIVTGSEQRDYFSVVLQAIREVFQIGDDRELEHISTGFLTLSSGKMSSRKGNVLTGESLLSEMRQEALRRATESRADDREALADAIAVAALKYQILRISTGSDIVFDQQQAFSFEGDSGPYLQYTHARTVSLCARAKEAGIDPGVDRVPETVYPLERYVYRFGAVLQRALQHRSPHHLVVYLTELASMFNAFYATEKIVAVDSEYSSYIVGVVQAVRQTLKNGLHALGIPAPEQM